MARLACFYPDHPMAAALPPEIRGQNDRHTAKEGTWDLCALSEKGAALLFATKMHCRTLLVPEEQYSHIWQVKQLVSYGLSSRSTLTLSGMGERTVLCVQRRIYTVSGKAIEESELFLPPAWNGWTPGEQLLLAGTWLLVRGSIPQ